MIFRSLIFNVVFYLSIFFCGILFLPLLVSKKLTRSGVKFWSHIIIFLLQNLIGANVLFKNNYIHKNKGYLIAANHQSVFDTIFFLIQFDKVIYVVKKELKFLPIYGWYAMRLGNIFIDRKDRVKSIKRLSKNVSEALENNYKVIIFPEGTRQTDNKIGIMKPGIYAIQRFCKKPIYPIYINSYLVWPKNSFIKKANELKIKTLKPLKYKNDKKALLSELALSLNKEHQKNSMK